MVVGSSVWKKGDLSTKGAVMVNTIGGVESNGDVVSVDSVHYSYPKPEVHPW